MEKRLIAAFSLFTLTAFLLFFRVGILSSEDTLAQTAHAQSSYTLTIERTRGQIYDCRMLPLVGEEQVYTAACLPLPENSLSLPGLLHMERRDAETLLREGKPFLAECEPEAGELPGVQVFPVTRRYSDSQIAQHILGYLDSSGKGVTGVEKAFEQLLSRSSRESTITYWLDGRGAPLAGTETSVSLAPAPTAGVVLTIDRRIQQVAEEVGRELLPRGAIVVMEPSTGKIRALASFPEYSWSSLEQAVSDGEGQPLLNRAFLPYNVGSTFKIVTAAAALEQGLPSSWEYTCGGYIQIVDQVFRCHDLAGHGILDLKEALEVSCNPYFIQMGQELDREKLLETARNFSFGKLSTFAEGFSSSRGNLPAPGELSSPAALGNLAFGQGTLLATPIQIAQMVCAVVNGGETPSASLIEGITENGLLVEERQQSPAPVRAMSPRTARRLQEYLTSCVMEVENQRAKPQYVTAGGKTGTAQTGRFKEDGEELLQGWFAGFFPAEEPRYVVAVLAEDARSGNQDASPVFREIADRLSAPVVLPPLEENP